MSFSFSDINVFYEDVSFQSTLSLSRGRKLSLVRERAVGLTIKKDGLFFSGRAEIFDSTQWAHPKHIYTHADTEKDLRFFSKGSEFIRDRLLSFEFLDIFDADKKIISLARDYADSCNKNYSVTPVMTMMLAAPFSIALFSSYEKSLGGRNIYNEISSGSLQKNFSRYLEEEAGISPALIPRKADHEATWMMTMDIGMNQDDALKLIELYAPKQIKIKIDSNPENILSCLEKIIFLHDRYGILFYVDCNQSFNSLDEFNCLFLGPARFTLPDQGKCLIGVEEPTASPLNVNTADISALGIDVYVDENCSDVDSALLFLQKGYHLALKALRPVSVILAQQQLAYAYNRKFCVQDLTFQGNPYFLNLIVYCHSTSNVGFEANHILFVDNKWGEKFGDYYNNMTCVSNGCLKLPEPGRPIFY